MRRFVLALLAAAAPLGAAAGDTRSVALVVTDAEGAFVPDIRAEEVRVLENGEPRELVAFERDERPLAVALVLDTSTGAARVFRGPAFDAVWSFVSRLPRGVEVHAVDDRGSPAEDRRARRASGRRSRRGSPRASASTGPNTLLDTLVEAAESLGPRVGTAPGARRGVRGRGPATPACRPAT